MFLSLNEIEFLIQMLIDKKNVLESVKSWDEITIGRIDYKLAKIESVLNTLEIMKDDIL